MSEEEIGQVTADQIMVSQMTRRVESLQHQIGLLESKISILEDKIRRVSHEKPESMALLAAQLSDQRNQVGKMVNRVLKMLDLFKYSNWE